MSILVLAAALVAQTSAATQPAVTPAVAAKKAKTAQVCEYLEVTGSRAKQRVCRDAGGHLDLGPGVSDSAFGKGTLKQSEGQATPAGPH
jgi:hypothetical protein